MSKYYCTICEINLEREHNIESGICKHDVELGIFHCKQCDALLDSLSPIIMNECCEVAYSQLIQEQPEAITTIKEEKKLPEKYSNIPICKECNSPISVKKTHFPSFEDTEKRKDWLRREHKYCTKMETVFLINCLCGEYIHRSGVFVPYIENWWNKV